jgi:hypothetical protein
VRELDYGQHRGGRDGDEDENDRPASHRLTIRARPFTPRCIGVKNPRGVLRGESGLTTFWLGRSPVGRTICLASADVSGANDRFG